MHLLRHGHAKYVENFKGTNISFDYKLVGPRRHCRQRRHAITAATAVASQRSHRSQRARTYRTSSACCGHLGEPSTRVGSAVDGARSPRTAAASLAVNTHTGAHVSNLEAENIEKGEQHEQNNHKCEHASEAKPYWIENI
jgi:hypothetical protein